LTSALVCAATEVHVSQLVGFSSFAPDEEQRFVPFEAAMRDNGRRALVVGGGVGAALLVALLGIVFGLYSPCNRFCARPPGPCHTEAQIAAWRASCESSCSAFARAQGTEAVQTLNACVFSGGIGTGCNSAIEAAQARGLWCRDK
jgi:hypothetical protein